MNKQQIEQRIAELESEKIDLIEVIQGVKLQITASMVSYQNLTVQCTHPLLLLMSHSLVNLVY